MPAVANNLTCDKQIRAALISELIKQNESKEHTKVIPELTLPNESVRVDVAVINGIMHGYELKSDVDTLHRLSNQVIAYNLVFDRVTLVVGRTLAASAIDIIPNWWGVTVAKTIPEQEELLLIPIRDAGYNLNQDLVTIANLLWKSEAIDCLTVIGKEAGYISKPKNVVCKRLIECTDAQQLKALVRDKLINRNFDQRKQAVLSLS